MMVAFHSKQSLVWAKFITFTPKLIPKLISEFDAEYEFWVCNYEYHTQS